MGLFALKQCSLFFAISKRYLDMDTKLPFTRSSEIRSLHALHFDPPDVLPRVAIHIRAGDKVNHQPGRAEMTVATFQRFYERGVAFCTQYALEPVLVVSDTPSVMQRFVSDAKLQHVVRATSLSQNEYTDFFALAQCETIVLVGVFSTYSIMAFFVGQGKHFIVFDESCKGIRYDDIMEVVTAQ